MNVRVRHEKEKKKRGKAGREEKVQTGSQALVHHMVGERMKGGTTEAGLLS